MSSRHFFSRRRILAGMAAAVGGMAGLGLASSTNDDGSRLDPVGIPPGLPEPPAGRLPLSAWMTMCLWWCPR